MSSKAFQVAIIGGGVAGSLAALRLAESGVHVELFEQGPELVNGPPICHLHAGGSLYRELSDEQCLTLLEQSIQTARSFPGAIRPRPTLIAVPKRDAGSVASILPRLAKLQQRYQQLVMQDAANQVLGDPEHYYREVSREQMDALAQREVPRQALSMDDWLINAAHSLDLDQLKFPLLLVQEYGVSLFRVAAMVKLAAEKLEHLTLHLNSPVQSIEQEADGWQLTIDHAGQAHRCSCDYLINAAGYQTGVIDDWVGLPQRRLVEFKAAYLAQWPEHDGLWPEIVIHGQRGTKNGMAQLTPYGEGIFQLHGMAPGITLFEQGLAQSSAQSAQPQLPQPLATLAQGIWPQALVTERTEAAIGHLATFIPSFKDATVTAKPLSGAQQIPGQNPDQRVSGASFGPHRYARSEIVKFSSALTAADDILKQLAHYTELSQPKPGSALELAAQLPLAEIDATAEAIVQARNYPLALARAMKK